MRSDLGIATGDTNLYPKQAVLLIGFMLEGSVVAMKIRNLVLETSDDLFDDIESPAIVEPTVQKEQYNIQSGELIKTEVNEANEIVISGRELYDFLEVKTPFHKWIVRMIEYGFVENQDFMVMDIFVPNSKGGKQNQMEYALKLDMAKEISMIQRNEKGKQARQYFIETEKKYKSQAVVPIHSYMIENPIERAKQWIEEQQEKMLLETKVQEQVEVIEEQAEEIEFKQDIIDGIAEGVPTLTQRQLLHRLITRGCDGNGDGQLISRRWLALYKEFELTN